MDIYQTTYNYCTAKNIQESQKRLFEILPTGSIGKCSESNLVVFNHIAFTGGVQLNDLILRSSGYSGLLFEIPDFNFYKNRDNYSGPKKFISAHFLNGIDSLIHMNCDYFTMLRDPVSHVLSVLTSKDDYFANSSNRVWDAVYSKLDFWENEVGHINLQTFEIATDYIDKKFKSIPGTDETPIHFFKNYISTNPDSLLKIADEKIKEKYLMVGITELYEESIFLLFSRLHIKKTKLWRPGFFSYWRPARSEIPLFIEEKIKSLTTVDHCLYNKYRELLERDFFNAEFAGDFTKYKILCKDHLLRLHMEFSERIQLGKALSDLSKDPKRGSDEIHHLIEFKNALEDLIMDELPYDKLQKIIEYYARRRERKLISL